MPTPCLLLPDYMYIHFEEIKVEDKKCSQTLSLGNFGLSLWFDMKLTKSSFIIHAQWYSLGIGGISCF